jgi:DAK2 domain fusion protein YloV
MPEPKRSLAADDLVAAVVAFRDALRTCSPVLNRLNVYPVPDGDTGKNMLGTMEKVVAELSAAGAPDLAAACKAIAYGSLMGASGNSGIILCQVLRGFTEAVRDGDGLGPGEVTAGLAMASKQADGAVAKPVEGTILTVVRASAHGAAEANSEGGDLETVLRAARAAAVDALARTPEQLPVLAQAGVVDAGGAGYCLWLDALLHVAAGDPLPDVPPVPEAALQAVAGGELLDMGSPSGGVDGEKDVSELRYEVMFLLEADDTKIPAFREVWTGVGDSIVVVGGEGLWNCHIHADDVGAAIEAALDTGRPRRIKVTDLLDQVEEERWVREAGIGQPLDEPALPAVPCAVVAVATGDGVRKIFRSLKVHKVVSGGQTMNPTTGDLLEAVESVPADHVVLLPNNKNIIAVAREVDALTSKHVEVVPTETIAEGFAALLDYDPESSARENALSMAGAASRVLTGEVTRAIRDTTSDAGTIATGDHIGISDHRIRTVAAELTECVEKLLATLLTDEHEIVTLIEGDGSSGHATRQITRWLEERFPHVACEVLHGGQPLYPYYVSIE